MTRPPPRAPRGAPADGGAARGAAAGPLLQVHDVRKAFGGLRAVDGASFDVCRGTISGLIGPNGAGKTTLFNLVTGFVAPDGGRVLFRGEDITGRRPHQVFRAGLCRTFQIPREFKDLTVLENLMVVPPDQVGERLWTPWLRAGAVAAEERRIRDKALGVLDFLTLLPLAAAPAFTLSGGQKKLLELARALMTHPRLVLLDEPMAGVNPTLGRRLLDYLHRLREERGLTVLFIEHDMDVVMGVSDEVIVMAQGQVIARGTPDQVRADERVIDAYLGTEPAAA